MKLGDCVNFTLYPSQGLFVHYAKQCPGPFNFRNPSVIVNEPIRFIANPEKYYSSFFIRELWDLVDLHGVCVLHERDAMYVLPSPRPSASDDQDLIG